MSDIIQKLKKSGLAGRGGAAFPIWQKWLMVSKAPGTKKYVVCNASEGEPGIFKDGYILEKFPDQVIAGMKVAMKFLKADQGFIYLNPGYYKKLEKKLKTAIGQAGIVIFKKDHGAGYVGGEETSALNHIEGRRIEPRVRPPFPPTKGLWGGPTLVNNVETFYQVNLISKNRYKNKRFYTINGDCLYNGVYEFPEDWTIEKILQTTDNYPKFDFFVQVGGDAAGVVLNSRQLNQAVTGAGSITVYSVIKHSPVGLLKKWLEFFQQESCGQCTPCREGNYRLNEIINTKEPNWRLFYEILDSLEQTAFCGLGGAVPVAAKSYLANVVPSLPARCKLPNRQGLNLLK